MKIEGRMVLKKQKLLLAIAIAFVVDQSSYASRGVSPEQMARMRQVFEKGLQDRPAGGIGGKLTPAERAQREANLRRQEEQEAKAAKGKGSSGTSTGGSRGTQVQSKVSRSTGGQSGAGDTSAQVPVYRSRVQEAADRRGQLTEKAERAVAEVEQAAQRFANQVRALRDKRERRDPQFEQQRASYLTNFGDQLREKGLEKAFTPKQREILVEGLIKAKNVKELKQAQNAIEKGLNQKTELHLKKENFESNLQTLLKKNNGVKPSGSIDKINQFRADLDGFEQGTVTLKTVQNELRALEKLFPKK